MTGSPVDPTHKAATDRLQQRLDQRPDFAGWTVAGILWDTPPSSVEVRLVRYDESGTGHTPAPVIVQVNAEQGELLYDESMTDKIAENWPDDWLQPWRGK